MVKELLAHPQIKVNKARTTDGSTPLFTASEWGKIEVVKKLLAHRQIDVNQATTDTGSSNKYKNGATPIFIATMEGHLQVVKELLADQRVNPNKVRTGINLWKTTPLGIAAWVENLEAVKLLLRCPKVILGIEDKDGKTALDYARENGYSDIVKAIESRQTLLQLGHTC